MLNLSTLQISFYPNNLGIRQLKPFTKYFTTYLGSRSACSSLEMDANACLRFALKPEGGSFVSLMHLPVVESEIPSRRRQKKLSTRYFLCFTLQNNLLLPENASRRLPIVLRQTFPSIFLLWHVHDNFVRHVYIFQPPFMECADPCFHLLSFP